MDPAQPEAQVHPAQPKAPVHPHPLLPEPRCRTFSPTAAASTESAWVAWFYVGLQLKAGRPWSSALKLCYSPGCRVLVPRLQSTCRNFFKALVNEQRKTS